MSALVVVHTETACIGLRNVTKRLFNKIAREIARYVRQGGKVYYLAGERLEEERDIPEQQLIYPAIRRHSRNMMHIPTDDSIVRQFLLTKKLLIEDGAGRVSICGIEYECCVIDLYHLLVGEENTECPKVSYEISRNELGWSQKDFDEIFSRKLDAQVREDLTDKLE